MHSLFRIGSALPGQRAQGLESRAQTAWQAESHRLTLFPSLPVSLSPPLKITPCHPLTLSPYCDILLIAAADRRQVLSRTVNLWSNAPTAPRLNGLGKSMGGVEETCGVFC
jgi:hypothetical protein